jgi:signal peptidase II
MVKNVFDNDFLWIYHVRNRAVAFSLGQELPEHLKPLLFVALPLMVLVLLMIYYFRSDEFNLPQRWFFAGIIGGGLGNMLDRTFRPTGVVDFISVKFYGFLGLERWPTLNIADAVVVICCSFLFLSILLPSRKEVRRTA